MLSGLFDFNISLNQIDLSLELIWFRAWQKVVSVFTSICSETEDREEIVGVEEYVCRMTTWLVSWILPSPDTYYLIIDHIETHIYFHDQWPHGSSNPLKVESENLCFCRKWYTGCPKMAFRKDIHHFVIQKRALTLALTKTQNCHLFSLLYLKNTPFHGYFVTCWWKTIFYDFVGFFGARWVKKMAILCFN